MITRQPNITRLPSNDSAVRPVRSSGDIFTNVRMPEIPTVDVAARPLPVSDSIGGIGIAKLVDTAVSLGLVALGIAAVKKVFNWIYNSR